MMDNFSNNQNGTAPVDKNEDVFASLTQPLTPENSNVVTTVIPPKYPDSRFTYSQQNAEQEIHTQVNEPPLPSQFTQQTASQYSSGQINAYAPYQQGVVTQANTSGQQQTYQQQPNQQYQQTVKPIYQVDNYTPLVNEDGDSKKTGSLICGIIGIVLALVLPIAGFILGGISISLAKKATALGYPTTKGLGIASISLAATEILVAIALSFFLATQYTY